MPPASAHPAPSPPQPPRPPVRQPLTARTFIRFRGEDGRLVLADAENQLPVIPDEPARLLVNSGYATEAPEETHGRQG